MLTFDLNLLESSVGSRVFNATVVRPGMAFQIPPPLHRPRNVVDAVRARGAIPLVFNDE